MQKIKFMKQSDWTLVEDALPTKERELYAVIQVVDGAKVRNAAYFEQDANGDWGFNKPNITHWRKWFDMPEDA